jgi:hypothetical protein
LNVRFALSKSGDPGNDPLKRWWAIALLATAWHFITHAHDVAREIEGELTVLTAEADIGWKPLPEST